MICKENVKTRILEVAGKLFAEKGFKTVTVREIIKNAETHLSALNYHFGSKENLYREVIKFACMNLPVSFERQEIAGYVTPREGLERLVRESLSHYRKDTEKSWQDTLLMRECWSPSELFEDIMSDYYNPKLEYIGTLLSEITGEYLKSFQIMFAAFLLNVLLETTSFYGDYFGKLVPAIEEQNLSDDFLVNHIVNITILSAQSR
jgi:AcrR family transcriptional regulator